MRLGRNFTVEDIGSGRQRMTLYQRPISYMRNGLVRPITGLLRPETRDELFPHGFEEALVGGFADRISPRRPVAWVLDRFDQRLEVWMLGVQGDFPADRGERSVFFPEAWSGADLFYQFSGDGIHKTIRLRDGHPSEFRFRFNQQPEIDRNGWIRFRGLRVAPPYMDGGARGGYIPLTWERTNLVEVALRLPLGNFAGWEVDPTVELQPDETGVDDVGIRVDSLGAVMASQTGASFDTGRPVSDEFYRALIRFDLTSIPVGASINAVTLTLTQMDLGGSVTSDHSLHRLLRAWVEAESTWAIWKTSNNWTAGGADGVGTDRESATAGPPLSITGSDTAGPYDWTLDPALFETMIPGGTFDNNGWRLRSGEAQNTNRRWHSSGSGTPTARPKLTIDYDPPVVSRLAHYTVNLWDPKGIILDRQGAEVPPNELRAERFIDLLGADLPGPDVYNNFYQDPTKTKIEEVTRDQDGARIKATASQFADALIKRSARGA